MAFPHVRKAFRPIRRDTCRNIRLISFNKFKFLACKPPWQENFRTEYLCKFILSVKRKDGKDFEPSSLRGLVSSFNQHLKECKYPVSVIEEVAFERARKCLKAKNKQLKKEGKGNIPNAAEDPSDDKISMLYEKNLMGISNGEALINTIWLFNSLHFGLRGCGEHRQSAGETFSS